jgi:hypothetical protein
MERVARIRDWVLGMENQTDAADLARLLSGR